MHDKNVSALVLVAVIIVMPSVCFQKADSPHLQYKEYTMKLVSGAEYLKDPVLA